MIDLQHELSQHLKQSSSAPFLFVGSGMSLRYLGLQNWIGLLTKFTQDIDKNYDFYRSKAGGDLPTVASLLAEDYHTAWFGEDKFSVQCSTDSKIAINRSSPLKIEISRYLSEKTASSIGTEYTGEIEAFKNIVVDGIITTNWDTLLEELFPGFKPYIGQNELLFSQPQSIAEIYKIHGCRTSPNSLVLTRRDYDDFVSRNAYLAARLLAVFVEHPVVFLGYSLGDSDIQQILESIINCLTSDNIDKLTNNLIFVEWDREGKGDSFFQQVRTFDGKLLPLTVIRASNYTPIYNALAEKKRAIPARLLRQLKEQLYELVLTNDPSEQMHVQDISDETDKSEIDIVFGVGVAENAIKIGLVREVVEAKTGCIGDIGYGNFDKNLLFRDVIFNNGVTGLDPKRLLAETLPTVITKSNYIPVFKYLSECSFIGADGQVLDTANLHERVIHAIRKNGSGWRLPDSSPKHRTIASSGKSVAELKQDYSLSEITLGLLIMDADHVSLAELQLFLEQHIDMLEMTNFRKLVCRYDYLRYGRGTVATT